jgi:2-methylaconitate cis-trans-isomerase PrpF
MQHIPVRRIIHGQCPFGSSTSMKKIPCTIIRGGSSKGIFVERELLPPEGPERDRCVLALFGSPDPRQIDGLGGADKLTSKTAIMGPPTREDCDVDYLFGQVNIALPRIDWLSNCGNISAGAAIYPIYKGWVKSSESRITVAIHQVNTGRRLLATVPLEDGELKQDGDFQLGGVPGTGARIDLDFKDFGGCILDKGILPTGHAIDQFTVPGIGIIDVSVIDMANVCLFVRASDVGMDHEQDVVALQNDRSVVSRLEKIRETVALELGVIGAKNVAEELLVAVNPMLFIVGKPRSYKTLSGTEVAKDAFDLFARSITRSAFSKAYPGSGSIATGVSCGIPGTISAEILRDVPRMESPYAVRVGHPGGILEMETVIQQDSRKNYVVESAVVGRTARVLMEGVAFIR